MLHFSEEINIYKMSTISTAISWILWEMKEDGKKKFCHFPFVHLCILVIYKLFIHIITACEISRASFIWLLLKLRK